MMMRWKLCALAPLAGVGFFACMLDPIDYTGKSCPCPSPAWRCDEATQLCAANTGTSGGGSSSSSAGSTTGSSMSSGASSGGGGCTPLITPSKLRVGWATPNAIRWMWDSAGTVDQFNTYRLVVGTSKASVESESGATIFTGVENPELGLLNLVHTSGIDPVTATITDGLTPNTKYFGKLVAVDSGGCEYATAVLSATTSVAPTGDLPLFVDSLLSNKVLPETIAVAECTTGSPCLTYTSECDAELLCYENLRLELNVAGSDIQAAMSAGDFANVAYLEMRVAADSSAASYWSEFRLKTDDWYHIDAQTIRTNGEFRTYQVPLRALSSSVALSYASFAAGIHEVCVGGGWTNGSHVWIDDIHLKW